MSGGEGILVWRSADKDYTAYPALRHGSFGKAHYCDYCGELLVDIHVETADWQGDIDGLDCYFCGWYWRRMQESWCSLYDEEQDTYAALTELAVDDASITFPEMAAELNARPALALKMSPRRFEEFVADAYRDIGFDVVLTPPTRDDGIDLYLLSNGRRHAIVEVKRHRNKLGVELVRQVRGVQMREDTELALLVSASGFTSGARREAAHPMPLRRGYRMQLADLTEVLSQLSLIGTPVGDQLVTESGRHDYRAWLARELGAQLDRGNPKLRSGGARTIAAGWWRL